ncbi:MAG: hypothetical protein WBA85_06565 [Brucella anthropi]
MNRRFFLKLLPVASAAVALPAEASRHLPTLPVTQPTNEVPTYADWQGDGYYEVNDCGRVRVMSVVRWSAFDDPEDGHCYRFSAYHVHADDISYRYASAMDAAIIRKVGEF